MKFGIMTKLLSVTAAAIIIAPLVSLMAKVPWSNFLGSLSDLSAIKLSIWTSTLAAVISLTLGVPLAWIGEKFKQN